MHPLWSWVLTGVGLTCFWLAGRKVWWAWYVGIAGQGTWLAYSLATRQWGFLVGVVLYTVVYVKNAAAWTREHRASQPRGHNRVRVTGGSGHVTINQPRTASQRPVPLPPKEERA